VNIEGLPWNARMAKIIWENIVNSQCLVPETLKFLLNTCLELVKKENDEESFRKILVFVLINRGLEPAINNPYGNDILENCKVPSCFHRMNRILSVLETIIRGQVRQKASKSLEICNLINISQ